MICIDCLHSRVERTGPHATVGWCARHQDGYPQRTECRWHDARVVFVEWPFDGDGWEWASTSRSASK